MPRQCPPLPPTTPTNDAHACARTTFIYLRSFFFFYIRHPTRRPPTSTFDDPVTLLHLPESFFETKKRSFARREWNRSKTIHRNGAAKKEFNYFCSELSFCFRRFVLLVLLPALNGSAPYTQQSTLSCLSVCLPHHKKHTHAAPRRAQCILECHITRMNPILTHTTVTHVHTCVCSIVRCHIHIYSSTCSTESYVHFSITHTHTPLPLSLSQNMPFVLSHIF